MLTTSASASYRRPRRFLRALFLWLALYAATVTLYNFSYRFTSETLIKRLQVQPAAFLIRQTLPEVPIHYTATAIRSPTLKLQIMRGCDGVEAWLLLVTAVVVFPVPARRRMAGVLYGTLLIMGLNLIRIVSLFHLAMKKPEWFELAHVMIWQSAMVLAAIAFVVIWMDPRAVGRASETRA